MDKLQEWLKDKKNQPIVAGVVILVLVIAGVVVYMGMNGGSGSGESVDDTAMTDMSTPTTPAPSSTPGASPATPAPGATAATQPTNAAKPGFKKVATAASAVGRTDPFLPVGWTRPKPPPPPPPQFVRVPDPVQVNLYKRFRKGDKITVTGPGPEIQQPPRRMAGLLLNGRIYAIIESNGTTQLVQPGDMLKDRLAVVDRIDRDKVVLRTTVGERRYIIVRMASASKQESTAGTAAPTQQNLQPFDPYTRRPVGPNRVM